MLPNIRCGEIRISLETSCFNPHRFALSDIAPVHILFNHQGKVQKHFAKVRQERGKLLKNRYDEIVESCSTLSVQK